MQISTAKAEDLERIMEVFDAARRFMRQTGNDRQWIDGYPSGALISENIRDRSFYVCLSDDGLIAGVFYFKVEEDKTYAEIYDGKWLNDEPYGVVHRMASNGKQKGVAAFCLQWCFEQCGNVRVDTHRDNTVMQNILRKNGYRQCGIIYVANGTERIAYQKSLRCG
jgi:RimJ/RimL family protein N-acetyltransferase